MLDLSYRHSIESKCVRSSGEQHATRHSRKIPYLKIDKKIRCRTLVYVLTLDIVMSRQRPFHCANGDLQLVDICCIQVCFQYEVFAHKQSPFVSG